MNSDGTDAVHQNWKQINDDGKADAADSEMKYISGNDVYPFSWALNGVRDSRHTSFHNSLFFILSIVLKAFQLLKRNKGYILG